MPPAAGIVTRVVLFVPNDSAKLPVLVIERLAVLTVMSWAPKAGATFVPAIAAVALMSALTISLTVRALLSFVGVTVSPEVNVYA
jgi:hypothetical protein